MCLQLAKDQQVQLAYLVREPFSAEEGLLQPLVEDPSKFFLDRKVHLVTVLLCEMNRDSMHVQSLLYV